MHFNVEKLGDVWTLDNPPVGHDRAPIWLTKEPAIEFAATLNRRGQIEDALRSRIGGYATVQQERIGGNRIGFTVRFHHWDGEDGPHLLLTDDTGEHYVLGIYDDRQDNEGVLIESRLNVERVPAKTNAFYPAASPGAVALWVANVAEFVLTLATEEAERITALTKKEEA